MTSSKQIKANGENAKLGGVKTKEGKMISKMNALKHGLLSKENLIKGESKADLEELNKKLVQELKPKGIFEAILVDRVAVNIWRLKRAMRVEKEMIQETKSSFSDKELIFSFDLINEDMLNRFARYETTIERGIYKAMHELERLREARKQMGSFGKNSSNLK